MIFCSFESHTISQPLYITMHPVLGFANFGFKPGILMMPVIIEDDTNVDIKCFFKYICNTNILVPAQDVPYALILWYVSKTIYLL